MHRLADKIIGLEGHLMELRKHIQDNGSKRRQEALKMVKHMNNLEDKRGQEVEEAQERKGWRDTVEGEDLNLGTNWRR